MAVVLLSLLGSCPVSYVAFLVDLMTTKSDTFLEKCTLLWVYDEIIFIQTFQQLIKYVEMLIFISPCNHYVIQQTLGLQYPL